MRKNYKPDYIDENPITRIFGSKISMDPSLVPYVSRTVYHAWKARSEKEMIGRHLNSDTAENSERGNPRWDEEGGGGLGVDGWVVVSVAESVRCGRGVCG